MRGGHNRKLDSIKAIQGTLRKNRINQNAPQVELKASRPSSGLPTEAKREYSKLLKILEKTNVLSEGDSGELENLALCRAQIKHLSKKLFAQNSISEFRKVQLAILDAIRMSASLSARFGLSPQDRERVNVIPKVVRKESDVYKNL